MRPIASTRRTRQIEADQASRPDAQAQGAARRLHRAAAPCGCRRSARYDWIMQQAATSGSDLPRLVTEAMTAIEAEFEPLQACCPRTTASSRPRCSKT